MEPPASVAAIILGWNLADETIACARTVLSQSYSPVRLIYVDNGSTDDSVARVRESVPEAEVVALPSNRGIAAGYNAGLHHALQRGDTHALILNNDTLLDPGCIEALLRAAVAHPEAGIFMPKIPIAADHRRLWSAGQRRRRFPPGIVMIGLGQPDGPRFSSPGELEYAPSCALLLTRHCLLSVGLFDPAYFFYYDDSDYCERTRRADLRIRYVPDAIVYHKVSLSTARSARPARWFYVMGRSTARFYRQYRRPVPVTLPLFALWFLARESVQGNGRHLGLFLRGIYHDLRGLPMPEVV